MVIVLFDILPTFSDVCYWVSRSTACEMIHMLVIPVIRKRQWTI